MEGEVWIGISFAKEYRLMISFIVDTTETSLAEPLIASTEMRLADGSWPVGVSDGLDAYGDALRGRHGVLETYPRTGKRGRPRKPKLVACPELKHGQVVKKRDRRHRVIGGFKHSVYGEILLEMISTVHIERHHLNLRQENRRLTRKTIPFSKKVKGLKDQITVYQSYFNFVRTHRGLNVYNPEYGSGLPRWLKRTPAIAAGLTDHIWTMDELMTKRLFINH